MRSRALTARHSGLKVHLVGHSAGSILLGGLAGANQAGGRPVTFDTCTMWAPACTMEFYRDQYLPAIRGGSIKQFAIFNLTDRAEQDDNCANIYHKSLLYLVSNAFERGTAQAMVRRRRRRAAARHGEVRECAARSRSSKGDGALTKRCCGGTAWSGARDDAWRL